MWQSLHSLMSFLGVALGNRSNPFFHINTQTHKGEIMSSNPYELRFDLPSMAQGYLQDKQEQTKDFAYQAWDLAREDGKANMELWKELQPESYSIEDIKRKATELYEFVEQK